MGKNCESQLLTWPLRLTCGKKNRTDNTLTHTYIAPPPRGKRLRRKLLHKTPRSVVSRYYELLTGHAAIGLYLKNKIHKAADDKYWCTWCGGGKQQTRSHHLFTVCKAWLPQTRKVWRAKGRAHGWKHPRAPAMKCLWKEKSTEAILEILRDTRVGCISTRRVLPEERLGDKMAGSCGEGEEGGRPPQACSLLSFCLPLVG